MNKKYLLILLISVMVGILAVILARPRFPANEGQSRGICLKRVNRIKNTLLIYVDNHNGLLPIDFYELIVEGKLKKHDLVCPSHYKEISKIGFFQEEFPAYITSYRLLTPNKKFGDISDGTIIMQEIIGNHPEKHVGGKTFSKGYHILIKKDDSLVVQFREAE